MVSKETRRHAPDVGCFTLWTIFSLETTSDNVNVCVPVAAVVPETMSLQKVILVSEAYTKKPSSFEREPLFSFSPKSDHK